MVEVCSMIARRSTLQFSDTTSLVWVKCRIPLTRHNFFICSVKVLIFSTFCLEIYQDKNMLSLKSAQTMKMGLILINQNNQHFEALLRQHIFRDGYKKWGRKNVNCLIVTASLQTSQSFLTCKKQFKWIHSFRVRVVISVKIFLKKISFWRLN